MEYSIKHLTEEDRKAFKETHELAETKEWAVMDGSIVFSVHDTELEAAAEQTKLNLAERIFDLYEVWREDLADRLGVSNETIDEAVQDHI